MADTHVYMQTILRIVLIVHIFLYPLGVVSGANMKNHPANSPVNPGWGEGGITLIGA